MRNERFHIRAGAIAAALALAACAASPTRLPQVEAWLATGGAPPPAQRTCRYVADVDLDALARSEATPTRAERSAARLARMQAAIDEIVIPASSPHRPGANASVVLRAVSPPGGLYSNTEWRVLWRDGDGVWWFWKQNRTNVPPPPPPPPGTQEHADFMARFPNGVIPDDIRWPPESGRLHADLAAALDSALFDPCRAWEPDIWPLDTPITRGARQPPPLPPQDSSQTYVELREGERARFIAGIHHRESLHGTLAGIAANPR